MRSLLPVPSLRPVVSGPRRLLAVLSLCAPLAFAGCGDSGGTGTDISDLSVARAMAACPAPFASCGGNPAGRWVISTFCDTPGDKPGCGATRDFSAVDIRLFLNVDGSFKTTDAPGVVTYTIGASCLSPGTPDGGAGVCEGHAPTGSTCVTTGSGECQCTASESRFPAGYFNFGGSGTWTLSSVSEPMDAGSHTILSIAAAGGSPKEYEYCVKDGVLQWELSPGEVVLFVKQQ